jgi:hypothetical protein
MMLPVDKEAIPGAARVSEHVAPRPDPCHFPSGRRLAGHSNEDLCAFPLLFDSVLLAGILPFSRCCLQCSHINMADDCIPHCEFTCWASLALQVQSAAVIRNTAAPLSAPLFPYIRPSSFEKKKEARRDSCSQLLYAGWKSGFFPKEEGFSAPGDPSVFLLTSSVPTLSANSSGGSNDTEHASQC